MGVVCCIEHVQTVRTQRQHKCKRCRNTLLVVHVGVTLTGKSEDVLHCPKCHRDYTLEVK